MKRLQGRAIPSVHEATVTSKKRLKGCLLGPLSPPFPRGKSARSHSLCFNWSSPVIYKRPRGPRLGITPSVQKTSPLKRAMKWKANLVLKHIRADAHVSLDSAKACEVTTQSFRVIMLNNSLCVDVWRVRFAGIVGDDRKSKKCFCFITNLLGTKWKPRNGKLFRLGRRRGTWQEN